MTTEQRKVQEFHNVFEVELPIKPEMPSETVRKLRARLIYEEAMETIAGLGFTVYLNRSTDEPDFEPTNNPDIVKIADGLADLHYVAYCGTACACGVDMEPIFAEVHRSNMSKLWIADELIGIPKHRVTEKIGMQSERRYIVRDAFGKIIKSPSYSPANIAREIEFQK